MLWWILLLFTNACTSGLCYNLDVNHPIIIKNPDVSQKKSYFGYSVVLYSEGKDGEKGLYIGAPKATYSRYRDKIQRSGVVYYCPFMNSCETEDKLKYDSMRNFDEQGNLTGSWTGGAMDISYEYKTLGISASSWQYHFSGQSYPKVRGGIFLANLQTYTLRKSSPLKEPLLRTLKSLKGLIYYARAQAGFSIHFIQNENAVLLGAPGVNNYVGTILKIENTEKKATEWDYKVMSPDGNYHEYAGYAVTSGRFYKKKQLYYVTGLPRGQKTSDSAKILYGAVLIFNFNNRKLTIKNQYDIELKAKFFGTQFGEYFGSSLAAGDLNGDGLDDLIVGAPFRSNDKNGFNHGSVYVIFGNTYKLTMDTKNRIDGTVSNGLFGQTVAFLGNLDNDGYGEFAISAPQEEISGVVYVYTYDKQTKRFMVLKKILGKDIYPDLRGFGMSFSKPLDIDDNHSLDILIGSPISGHAVLLRSKPIVFVHKTIRVNSTLSKSSTTLALKCCYSYDNFEEPTFTIIRNLTVDGDLRRFSFKYTDSGNQSEKKEIKMEKRKEYCEDISVFKLTMTPFNYEDPISITLTYRIPENETANTTNPIIIPSNITERIGTDNFCKTCPLPSHKSSKTETKLVMWDHHCNGQTCVSELVVDARFINLRKENTYIVGSKEPLFLEVNVSNVRDPAFTPQLELTLPSGIYFRKFPPNCGNSEDGNVTCDLGEQLAKKVVYNYEFNIDENDLLSDKEITFLLNSSTTTLSINRRNRFNITIKLEKEADFEITGESKQSTYIYSKKETTEILNIFKVEKIGPSPMSEIEMNILVPYEIKDSKGIFRKFADFREYQDKNAGSQLTKCQNITEYEEGISTIADLINYREPTPNNNNTDPMFDPKNIFYLNCTTNNVKCGLIKCLVGPFDSVQKYSEVAMELKVTFKDLEGMLKLKQLIKITSVANIVIENFTQSGNRSDFTEISNLLIIQKEYRIPTWILIVAAVVGLIILVPLTTCLAMAGFFKRKDQEKLKQLKEEALEEEQLLDDLIEHEKARGRCMEENEVYGFLRNHKPNQEQSPQISEENECYGDLLYEK